LFPLTVQNNGVQLYDYDYKNNKKFVPGEGILLPTKEILIMKTIFYSSRSEVYTFVVWGSREDRLGRSNLDLPIYISMVSAQLPSNKTKSRPLTVVHSFFGVFLHFLLASLSSGGLSLLVTGARRDPNPYSEDKK